MPSYTVMCQTPGCGTGATFKIAAQWSDDVTVELKTYALCCGACLPKWFETAQDRQRLCKLTAGETHSQLKVFEREKGPTHRPELEL